jgi:hypothetical protein
VGVELGLTRLGLGVSQGKSVIVLHHSCNVIKYYNISKIGLNCSKRCSLKKKVVVDGVVVSFKQHHRMLSYNITFGRLIINSHIKREGIVVKCVPQTLTHLTQKNVHTHSKQPVHIRTCCAHVYTRWQLALLFVVLNSDFIGRV